MTLIVEDGSRVAGANTYVSLAEFKAWADARLITYSSDSHVNANILRAMDYIEDLSFIGFKETETQSLQWPRVNVVIDGFGLDEARKSIQVVYTIRNSKQVGLRGDYHPMAK